nr:PREDICTED: adrenodoxin-like [Latimeria chalumnae]|eukprot:XP_014345260.1 PREDICTED: adrenodoxin-like [Latimeria chalumnae]
MAGRVVGLRPFLGALVSGGPPPHLWPSAVGEGRRLTVFSCPPQRGISLTSRFYDTPSDSSASTDKVTIHFINRDGEKRTAVAKQGESFLDVVLNQNLEIDGFGACEGTLACSTCHLIFDKEVFKKLGPIADEEMDMLDLAYGLSET